MKLNKKFFLTIPIFASVTALSAVAVACGNTQSTQSAQSTPQQTSITYNKSNNLITINLDANDKLVSINKFPKFNIVQLNWKNPQTTSNLQTKFDELFKKDFWPQVNLENSPYLVLNTSKVTNYPKTFNLEIDGNKFIVNYDSTNSYLNLGALGEKRTSGTTVDIKSVDNQITLNYKVQMNVDGTLYNVQDFSFNTSTIRTVPISPSFQQTTDNITINPQNFVNLHINWDDPSKPNYQSPETWYDGRVVKIADGDTFTVEPSTTTVKTVAGGIQIGPGKDSPILRLEGIDTPEKAIQRDISSPFEYDFAFMSTKFAEKLFEMYPNVRVGFATTQDAFHRVVADVFFGPDYQYSYSVEITRAGYTLPFGDETGWAEAVNALKTNTQPTPEVAKTYYYNVYPAIANAMYQALNEHIGYYHYFNSFDDIQQSVYRMKENSKWKPFATIYQELHPNTTNTDNKYN